MTLRRSRESRALDKGGLRGRKLPQIILIASFAYLRYDEVK